MRFWNVVGDRVVSQFSSRFLRISRESRQQNKIDTSARTKSLPVVHGQRDQYGLHGNMHAMSESQGLRGSDMDKAIVRNLRGNPQSIAVPRRRPSCLRLQFQPRSGLSRRQHIDGRSGGSYQVNPLIRKSTRRDQGGRRLAPDDCSIRPSIVLT